MGKEKKRRRKRTDKRQNNERKDKKEEREGGREGDGGLSEKPVKNQGFKLFNFGLVSKFVDKEVYDLLNVINWLEGILT